MRQRQIVNAFSGRSGQFSGRRGVWSGYREFGDTLNWGSAPGNLLPPGFSLTRASTGTLTDFEGRLVTVPNGCVRAQGARFVQNLARESLSSWTAYGTASLTTGITAPDGTATAFQVDIPAFSDGIRDTLAVFPAGATYIGSCWIKADSAGTVSVLSNSGIAIPITTLNVTTSWQRMCSAATTTAVADSQFWVQRRAGNTLTKVYIWRPQAEIVGGSVLTPSEYVSLGVLSAPFHGAGVDGVKYFGTQNGNTVASNIVTEATGATLTTFDGTIVEAAATNSLLQSRTLSTAPWTLTGTAGSRNATGIDGTANTAWTLTDASAVAFDGYYQQTIVISNDSNNHAVSCRFLKDANSTTFSALRISLGGGTAVTQDLVINTSTGAFTVQASGGVGGGTVNDEGLWWKATVYATNNSTGNTLCAFQILPGYTTGTTASAATVTAQRSVVVDQFDHRPNSTVTDSPIVTAGVAVTRAADVLTAPTSGLLVNGQGFAAIGFRPITAPTTGDIIAATNLPMSLNAGQLSLNDGTAARDFLAAALTVGTSAKLATTWGNAFCNGAFNGTVGTQRVFDTDMGLGATITLMGGTPGVLQSLRLGTAGKSAARLANLTV
jgi:hypothetical protein